MSAAKKSHKVGDVCKQVDIQPYVLRYWETEFPALEGGGKGKGARTYTEDQVQIVRRIKALLYDEGHTIAGAKKKLAAELESGSKVKGKTSAEADSGKTTSGKTEPRAESSTADEADAAAELDSSPASEDLDAARQRLSEVGARVEGLLDEARDLLSRLDS